MEKKGKGIQSEREKIGFETVTDLLEGGEKKTKEIDLGIVTFQFCILIKKYFLFYNFVFQKKEN